MFLLRWAAQTPSVAARQIPTDRGRQTENPDDEFFFDMGFDLIKIRSNQYNETDVRRSGHAPPPSRTTLRAVARPCPPLLPGLNPIMPPPLVTEIQGS